MVNISKRQFKVSILLVTRISPEAPVPVVEQKSIENRAGGSANVALNVRSLGAKVSLLSIGRHDHEYDTLSEILSKTQIETHILKIQNRKTTTKTRVLSGNQQLLRIDHEDKHDIGASEVSQLIDTFNQIINNTPIDGIIFQDYNKGMLTTSLISTFINTANEKSIPTFVDPKEKNFFAYESCTLFKPNKKEIRQAVGSISLHDADILIKKKLQNKYTIITLGSEGIYINDGFHGKIYPTTQKIGRVNGDNPARLDDEVDRLHGIELRHLVKPKKNPPRAGLFYACRLDYLVPMSSMSTRRSGCRQAMTFGLVLPRH